MSEENTITDEQIEKFFETGGEEALEGFESDADSADDIKEPETEAAEPEGIKNTPNDEIDAIIRERDNYKKAMDSERIQRKEAQQELQRLKTLEEKLSELEKNKSPEIDFDEQPLEALKKQNSELLTKQEHFDNYIKSKEEEAKLKQEFDSFSSEVQIKTHEFAKNKPDYSEAYQHLMESRTSELRLQGYQESDIKEIVAQDELSLAYNAMKNGVNPGELVYNLSKHRGYVPKAETSMNEASEKLDRIGKGTALSKSLGGTGGNVSVDFSIDSLDGMSQDEIDKLVADEASWEKLMGSN